MNTEEIVQIMSNKGLRITDQRKTMVKLFAESEGYLVPKEVYEYMGKKYPGLSFDTVYRNLRILNEMGIVEQFVFEDGIKFKLHCNESHHHHHLFCLQCEKTMPLMHCPMNEIADIPQNFEVIKHKFEVYGYCEDCRNQANE